MVTNVSLVSTQNLSILLLLILAGPFAAGYSQPVDVEKVEGTGQYTVTPHTDILRTMQPVGIDSVLKSLSRFRKAEDKQVLIYNYDPYYYWFRLVVQNRAGNQKKTMLLMGPAGILDARLYQKSNSVFNEVAHAGLRYRFRDKSYQYAHHVFPFTLPANSIDTVYLSINANNAYKSFGFALMEPKDLKIFENQVYFIFGIIEGLLTLFFVLNISLFFVIKEKIHLWYSLYISLLFFIVLKNDHLEQQFFGLDSERAFRLTPYMSVGAFAIAVLMHVVQTFFHKVIASNKMLYRISCAIKINLIISAIVHFFVLNLATDYRVHSMVFTWTKFSTLLGTLVVTTDCLYALKKGNKSAVFILIGTVVFIAGSIRRLYFPSTLSFLFPPTTFHIGIVVETVVISLGLIFKYLDEKELERKREEEIIRQTMHDISEEIHDNVGQILTLANLNLNSLDIRGEQLHEKIPKTRKLISKAILDLRNLSRTLKNEELPESNVVQQIEAELLSIENTGLLKTEFFVDGSKRWLDSKEAAIILRIVKEGLQNVIKHSKASIVKVLLHFTQADLHICLEDNGIGFDTATAEAKSNGLKNIEKRCRLLNAECRIYSQEGAGTKISVVVPLIKAEEEQN